MRSRPYSALHFYFPRHVIYSATQHASSDRRPIYKDSGKFWNKWRPAERKIWKCIFCGNEWKNSHISRWNRGLHIVIWSFSLIPLSRVFHSPPYLCLYALFTRTKTREVATVAAKCACLNVCWCTHGAEESGVHMMNEIVRKQRIYGCECSHPFWPAVPGCPQGHRAPLGPILGGSLWDPTAAADAAAATTLVSARWTTQ